MPGIVYLLCCPKFTPLEYKIVIDCKITDVKRTQIEFRLLGLSANCQKPLAKI